MGSKRYEKYSDPLTPVQKRELKKKEYKPDGEKQHLQIISYSPEKLVDIISDPESSVFYKSIAKEEILRRLVRNQKRQHNADKIQKKQKEFKKAEKSRPQIKSSKTGVHIGDNHSSEYKAFIDNGGDPESCPFD